MTESLSKASQRLLEPIERISEVLFGLIMVLTFTGSLSAATAGHSEIRTMLIGALGCNLGWGIIDGVMYLMACLSERRGKIRALRAVQCAATPEAAHRVIEEALPPLLASVLTAVDFEAMRMKLNQMPPPDDLPGLTTQDWYASLRVLALVFLSTFPVVIPFLIVSSPRLALRISNTIAVGMLFLTGYAYGRCAGYHPLKTGVAMVVLGGVLVGITIVLGG
jgi:VIT1/CCC1 family predicted Fe2+/Mn2+ transporter